IFRISIDTESSARQIAVRQPSTKLIENKCFIKSNFPCHVRLMTHPKKNDPAYNISIAFVPRYSRSNLISKSLLIVSISDITDHLWRRRKIYNSPKLSDSDGGAVSE